MDIRSKEPLHSQPSEVSRTKSLLSRTTLWYVCPFLTFSKLEHSYQVVASELPRQHIRRHLCHRSHMPRPSPRRRILTNVPRGQARSSSRHLRMGNDRPLRRQQSNPSCSPSWYRAGQRHLQYGDQERCAASFFESGFYSAA